MAVVALVLLSPIKAPVGPAVQSARSGVGDEPASGCRVRLCSVCPSVSPCLAQPKMQRPAAPAAPLPLSLLLLLVLAATAQGQEATGSKELQPWLVGLTAVVVFLFIVFVVLLANRLWRIRTRRKSDESQESQEIHRVEKASYENPAVENEEEKSKATSL
ncbi:small integral membrane protein 24 [Apteryx rowi]|uniref:small integral membrane protein 24 n=1 Tax=Apteryx rowi TaxID=308060 RepID=UPI000E1CA8FA|nr:small integral membrane protein 24 [Apteryx rowi]